MKLFLKIQLLKQTNHLKAAKELAELNIKIIIGPVFNENLIYLNELKNITFLSLTNKNNNFSRNIINAGIEITNGNRQEISKNK